MEKCVLRPARLIDVFEWDASYSTLHRPLRGKAWPTYNALPLDLAEINRLCRERAGGAWRWGRIGGVASPQNRECRTCCRRRCSPVDADNLNGRQTAMHHRKLVFKKRAVDSMHKNKLGLWSWEKPNHIPWNHYPLRWLCKWLIQLKRNSPPVILVPKHCSVSKHFFRQTFDHVKKPSRLHKMVSLLWNIAYFVSKRLLKFTYCKTLPYYAIFQPLLPKNQSISLAPSAKNIVVNWYSTQRIYGNIEKEHLPLLLVALQWLLRR